MITLARFLDTIDRINEWIGRIFSFLIIGLMTVVVSDTCLRYFFSSPLYWGMDMDKILLLAITFLGGGYCFLHSGHVKVDVLYGRLPLRLKAVVDLVTYLFLFSLCVVLVKYGGQIAWKALSIGEINTEGNWGFLMWPILMIIPVGAVLIGLQALVKWIRDLVTAITGVTKLESKVVRGEGGLRG